MSLGAARDVRLGHLAHGDGGLDARLDADTEAAYLQAVPSDQIFLVIYRWRTRRSSEGEDGRGGGSARE